MMELKINVEIIAKYIGHFSTLTILPHDELLEHGVEYTFQKIMAEITEEEGGDTLRELFVAFFRYFKNFWSRKVMIDLWNYTSNPSYKSEVWVIISLSIYLNKIFLIMLLFYQKTKDEQSFGKL